jgi:hypothetical protein
LKIYPYFARVDLSLIVGTVWKTSDYGDRLVGFQMVLVTNATNAKM